jgi:hypothetical protein
LVVEQLELGSSQGEPTLRIESCETDQTLFARLLGGRQLGTVRISDPTLYYTLDRDGISNVTRTFARVEPEMERDRTTEELLKRASNSVALSCEIHRATFVYRARPERPEWSLGGLSTTAKLYPGEASGGGVLVVEPGRLVDHLELTPEICRDLLQYVAPALAGTSWVEGRFTMEMREMRLPLEDPRVGKIDGTLTIHSVRAGPGPLVTGILSLFEIPNAIQLIEESPVTFELVDQRVHHTGLQFGAGEFHVSTSGSVGLDESLDLIAEVQLPTFSSDRRPVLQALSGKAIRIPIKGTLARPEVDKNYWQDAIADLTNGALQPMLDENATWLDIVTSANELRKDLRQRREVSGANANPPARRPRLRELLRRADQLLDTIDPPAENPRLDGDQASPNSAEETR